MPPTCKTPLSKIVSLRGGRAGGVSLAVLACLLLTACSNLVDMAKPGSTTDMMAVNSRMQANVEDGIALQAKFHGLVHGQGGGLSEVGVYSVESLQNSAEEAATLAKRLGMTEVTDRNDPDASEGTYGLSKLATKFRAGDPDIKFYKVKGNPEPLKLSTGRRFEHGLYFYDTKRKFGLMQLSYASMKDARAAEDHLEKIMTPKAPPPDLLARAEKGDAVAQYQLGKFYQKNNPFNRGTPLTAEKWYRKAAEQGNVKAQYELGCVLQREDFVGHDNTEAQRWLTTAAKSGHTDAQATLGKVLSYGIHTDTAGSASPAANTDALAARQAQSAKSKEWLRKSAEGGSIDGMYSLAMALRDTPAEKQESIALLKKVVDIGGKYQKLHAANALASYLNEGGEQAEAFKYLQIAADSGDAGAQSQVGDLLFARSDYAEAARYFRMACEQSPIIKEKGFITFMVAGATQYNQALDAEKAGDPKKAAILFRTAYTVHAQEASF